LRTGPSRLILNGTVILGSLPTPCSYPSGSCFRIQLRELALFPTTNHHILGKFCLLQGAILIFPKFACKFTVNASRLWGTIGSFRKVGVLHGNSQTQAIGMGAFAKVVFTNQLENSIFGISQSHGGHVESETPMPSLPSCSAILPETIGKKEKEPV